MDRAADVAYSFAMDDFYLQYTFFLTLFQIVGNKRFQILGRKWMEIQNPIYFYGNGIIFVETVFIHGDTNICSATVAALSDAPLVPSLA